MLKFRQFLKEMPRSVDLEMHSHMLDDGEVKPAGKFDREEEVGHVEDYTIHARSWKSQDSDEQHSPHHYIAVHSDTGEAHMTVRGGTTKDGYLIANDTKKHPDCEISAPEMYHEILHAGIHKGIQSGDQQSEGGKSIWYRLHHNHPDVTVTHHDSETGKKIKLHSGDDWDKNFDQEKPTHFRVKLKD